MLSNAIRILNFDDSLIQQRNLLARFQPDIIDLKALGPSCRLWMDSAAAGTLQAALRPEARHMPTFLGSGDFHHVSHLLISQFQEPLTVIVFDFHPDWDILPPALGCGSWVSRVLENKNVKKVILIGVSSGDIASPTIHTGNLAGLLHDRCELYPYAHKPTGKIFRQVPENISLHVSRHGMCREIRWQELQGRNTAAFLLTIIKRLETRQVYVSIDKDCLKADAALTNWEEGCLALDELTGMVQVIHEYTDIVGLDIVGDYSPPVIKGTFKALCSRLDHPRDYSAKEQPARLIHSINEQTNLRLLEAVHA
jgi:arginase family enzyme